MSSVIVREIACDKGCCKFYITDYKDVIYSVDDDWKEADGPIKKAGCFIYDPVARKILLVQSRAFMWGCPKGSLQPLEAVTDCALREVDEETGITLTKDLFKNNTVIRSKYMYYLVHMTEVPLEQQAQHISKIAQDALDPAKEHNDVNGMGWARLDCLPSLIKSKKISVNHNTRILLERFLNYNLHYHVSYQANKL